MNITFFKYQGAGNDFIIIDNRSKIFPKKTSIIKKLCHRNFGIGADGLILLEDDLTADFKMIYYNADGNESTMCGNGGRCIAAFAHKLELYTKETTFTAIDGLHHASIEDDLISLQMIDVTKVNVLKEYCFLNTGSPHHVQIVNNLAMFDVYTQGKQIRNQIYGSEGSNVNFVEQTNPTTFTIRTYERGVENETLACGTGATAVALAMHITKKTNASNIKIITQGGDLYISFTEKNEKFYDIKLKGPAKLVFKGNIEI